MDDLLVRVATPADAPRAVELLCSSITELCVLDHKNDPATLERWLSNKTPSNLEKWTVDPDNFVVVAEFAGELVGIGLLRTPGRINLCYMRPGRTRLGIGSAILERLEVRAREWGLPEIVLTSTVNARPFYERHGFVSDGEPSLAFGMVTDYPYKKLL
jgi:GNAT superfamily N-acetyltransferase